LNIEIIKIDELIPYEQNPRDNKAAVDAVANSIANFGFKVPIIIDQNNVIVAGHTRLLASQKLELDEVPCIRADDLTDEQIRAFRIADNKTAELADWDLDKLTAELAQLEDIDMTEFGFDLSEFEIETEVEEDDFDSDAALEAIIEPKSKPGNIYMLGNHRLMCGDSTKSDDLASLMNGEKADLLLTDPPYNIAYEGGTKDRMTIENDNMSGEDFFKFLLAAFQNASDNMRDGASFYVWYASKEVVNFTTALEKASFGVRQELIWNKSVFTLGRQDYQWKHEPCLYGWKDGAAHYFTDDRTLSTVIDFDKPSRSELHPTMKPVELFAYQIKNSSKRGGRVLDLFGGSGTTIIACEQSDRAAYVMEFDPKYCDVIIERWEKLTGKTAELIQ